MGDPASSTTGVASPPGGGDPEDDGRRLRPRRERRPPLAPDDSDSDPPAKTSATTSKRRARGSVCAVCKRLKMNCTGGFPCDRCWRLAIPCRPQSAAAAAVAAAAPASSRSSLSGGAGDGPLGLLAAGESGGGVNAAAASPLVPLLELAFARTSPRVAAEVMMQSFMALHATGQVVRAKALGAMRIYADLAEVFGSDPTWGLHAVMMSALKCTAIDLADPEDLLYDPSPAARQAALRARMMGLQETTRQARDDPMFHQLDEQAPGAAIFYTLFRDDGKCGYASNPAFDAWFQGALGFLDDMIRHKSITVLLIAILLDPDDRRVMFDAIVSLYADKPKRHSMIVKAFDGQGEMGLFLLTIHPGRLPPAPNTVGAFFFAIRFERLPPSRHLSLRPGHWGVMQTFRRDQDAATAAAADGTPATATATAAAATATAARRARLVPLALPAPGDGHAATTAAAFAVPQLPALVAIPSSGPIDAERMEAAAFGALGGASFLLPAPPPRPPVGDGGAALAPGAGAVDASIFGAWGDAAAAEASTQSAEALDQTQGALALPWATSPLFDGWEGVGTLAGTLSDLVDMEMLQAVFADGDDAGGGEGKEEGAVTQGAVLE